MIDLMLGDTIEKMSMLEDKSVDFILCDLPYGITAPKWDEVINSEDLWNQ